MAPRSVLNFLLVTENIQHESQFTFSIISSSLTLHLRYPLTELNLLQVFYNLIPSLIRNIMQHRIPVPLVGEYYYEDRKTSMFCNTLCSASSPVITSTLSNRIFSTGLEIQAAADSISVAFLNKAVFVCGLT